MPIEQASGLSQNQNTVAGDNSGANTPQPQDSFALKFATLAKQEAKLRSERERFKALEAEANEYKSLRESAKQNPKSVLEKFGLSTDDLVTRELASLRDPKEIQEEEWNTKLSTLEAKIAEREKKEAEQANQHALQSQLNAIRSLVDESEDFELIKTLGDHDLVWETAVGLYHQTGSFVDYKEAAEHVQKHLEERMDKVSQTNWFKKRYMGANQEAEKSDNPYMGAMGSRSDGQTLRNESNFTKPAADTTDRNELFKRAVSLLD